MVKFTRSDLMTVVVIPTLIWLMTGLPAALALVQNQVSSGGVTWALALSWLLAFLVGLGRFLATRIPELSNPPEPPAA